MPRVPIIMPQLGESIAEATITQILVRVGDTVAADQEVMMVETNKATMSLTSPCSGTVASIAGHPARARSVGERSPSVRCGP